MRGSMVVLLAALAVVCAVMLVGCDETTGVVVCVTDNCTIRMDKSGKDAIHVKSGRMITWCNEGTKLVIIRVSDRKLLAGSTTVRLYPGERATRRVGTLNPGEYKWTFVCLQTGETGEEAEKGSGGGPVIVDPKP